MSNEKDAHRYWHAEHCGAYMDIKTSGTEEAQARAAGSTLTKAPCILCGASASAHEVTRFEHERYTALEDDCKNCGDAIIFMPDKLEWRHHEGVGVEVTEPDYGLRSCSAAMAQLLGLPVTTEMPDYQGMVAEPAGTHVSLDFTTGEELSAKEAAVSVEREIIEREIKQKKAKAALGKSLGDGFLRSLGD